MGDLSITSAAALVARTLPFLLMRTAVYFGIAAAFAVGAAGGSGIGVAFGALTGPAGGAPASFWGAAAGMAAVAALLYWLREYLLYFVDMGHATALALALPPAPPAAQGRTAAAMSALQRRFRDPASLLKAEHLADGTLRNVFEHADRQAWPVPSGVRIPRVARDSIISALTGFIKRALLAEVMRRKSRSPHADLRDVLILFAQNQAHLIRNALLIAAGSLLASLIAFIPALVAAILLLRPQSFGAGLIAIAIAVVLVWSTRRALIEPLAAAAFLELFARSAAGQEPDPDWDARLTAIAPSFAEIKAAAAPARPLRRGVTA